MSWFLKSKGGLKKHSCGDTCVKCTGVYIPIKPLNNVKLLHKPPQGK